MIVVKLLRCILFALVSSFCGIQAAEDDNYRGLSKFRSLADEESLHLSPLVGNSPMQSPTTSTMTPVDDEYSKKSNATEFTFANAVNKSAGTENPEAVISNKDADNEQQEEKKVATQSEAIDQKTQSKNELNRDWAKRNNFSFVLDEDGKRLGGMAEPKERDDLEKIVNLSDGKKVVIISLTEKENEVVNGLGDNDPLRASIESHHEPLDEKNFLSKKEKLAEISGLIALAHKQGKPVFVHCREGVNRTGGVLGHFLASKGMDVGMIQEKLGPRGTPPTTIKMVYRTAAPKKK